MLFLFEVEEYRRLTSPAFQAMKAQALHSKYLHSLAILPVPVSIASRYARTQINLCFLLICS